MSSPELSIIILSFNTKDITLQCLDSIYKSMAVREGLKPSPTFEIIVWDNASHDGSVEALETYAKTHDNLVFIPHKENIGFGRGNNRAVEKAKGKYILCLNSDTIILDNAIGKMLEFYKENEDYIHFLGPKIFNKDMTDQPSAAPFYTPPVVFGSLFLRGDLWGLTRYSPDKLTKVDWLHGACFLTKKEYYEKLKGFDESIFMYMEEVDLQYRASKLGYTSYFYPEAQIIHLGSASSGGKTFPILQVYKGFLWFYKRHYGQFSIFLLKRMLQLKALFAYLLGRLTGDQYLINTYAEAYELVDLV
jgi:GT2 family glycosyltransferase